MPRVDVHQRNRFHPVSVGPSGRRAVSHSDPVAPSLLNFTVVLRIFLLLLDRESLTPNQLCILRPVKWTVCTSRHSFAYCGKKARLHLKACEYDQGQILPDKRVREAFTKPRSQHFLCKPPTFPPLKRMIYFQSLCEQMQQAGTNPVI